MLFGVVRLPKSCDNAKDMENKSDKGIFSMLRTQSTHSSTPQEKKEEEKNKRWIQANQVSLMRLTNVYSKLLCAL